ncbi:50S ribosomal protein L23 [Candidatus Woesearchaeota archaeon]|nr:50S ribosomal protein L23 [Candidatus Woesearchaeota archaeon]
MLEQYNVIKKLLNTEKSVRTVELENKLIFEVNLKAKKNEIKKAVEDIYNIKVIKVNTIITPLGKKKAYVLLHKDKPAIDLVTQLGIK